MMETMIPPQVGMRLRTKNKKRERKEAIKREGPKKKKRKKEAIKRRENAQVKKREKKREGAMLLSFFPHLCFKVAP